MTKKPPKSPQDKKSLSYAKDRRNTYGQNNKASRKAIPLRKAKENRQDRRKANQAMARIPRVGEEVADLLESSVFHDVYRVGGWTKAPDEQLGKVVANAIVGRENRVGRKMRSAQGKARGVWDEPDTLSDLAARLRKVAHWVTRRNPARIEICRGLERSANEMESRAAALRAADPEPK